MLIISYLLFYLTDMTDIFPIDIFPIDLLVIWLESKLGEICAFGLTHFHISRSFKT